MKRFAEGDGQGPGFLQPGWNSPGPAFSTPGYNSPIATESATGVLPVLLRNHERFRAFLARRLRSREDAEEILQAAFVKSVEKGGDLRDGESAVAWFYRLLRNALADRGRRKATEEKARRVLEARAVPLRTDRELERAVCRCINDLLGTLKPEEASLIRDVDLGGASPADAARARGITVNNAGVRLFRARKALRRALEASCGTCTEHGCLDCHCRD